MALEANGQSVGQPGGGVTRARDFGPDLAEGRAEEWSAMEAAMYAGDSRTR